MFGFFVVRSVDGGLFQRSLNLSDLGTSKKRRPMPELACCTTDTKISKNAEACRAKTGVNVQIY